MDSFKELKGADHDLSNSEKNAVKPEVKTEEKEIRKTKNETNGLSAKKKENRTKNTKTNADKKIKRTIKDCVFSDYFGMPENLLSLYQYLHPDDKQTKVDDLEDITIQNVLVDDIYNDLGFRIGNRLMILVEAQSTWSYNILIRVLLYLAESYQRYINENELDVYARKKIDIPKPEFYVIYTGNRENKPEELSLSKEFFGGKKSQLELKVKMLYGTGGDDVVSQYVTFAKVFDDQRKHYKDMQR